MEGRLHFERKEWSLSKTAFLHSKSLYETLSSTEGISPQKITLCQAAVDDMEPSLKYCLYILRENVANSAGDGSHQSGSGVGVISFRGENVPSKNVELLQTLSEIETMESDLEKISSGFYSDSSDEGGKRSMRYEAVEQKLDIFSKLLGAYWEACKLADADLKNDQVISLLLFIISTNFWKFIFIIQLATLKVKSSKSSETTSHLKFASHFVHYMRLSRTCERSLLLLDVAEYRLDTPSSSTTKTTDSISGDKRQPKREDAVRLADSLLLTVGEMSELEGVKENVVLQAFVSAKTTLFKAKRYFACSKF
jgi:signal recognition particle subunit SRP68